MKKICVITSARADYGLLKPLIQKIQQTPFFLCEIVATGMHLDPAFGLTYQEIEADGIMIAAKIEIDSGSDSRNAMSKTMALALGRFADYFADNRPDLLVVLGDRFEIEAICCAAVNERIPIAHLYGGETTEGAVDECYRHAISKMSYLHFVSCEPYRKRVIQLGEEPERVFNVGSLGVENVLNSPLLTLEELEQSLGFSLQDKPYGVVTFHPVTLENDTGADQLRELITALRYFKDMRFIITKSNSDAGGRELNFVWDECAKGEENWCIVTSLGMQKYLSALRYAAMMVGNSSSGIVEGPAWKIPTVNIGDRQKGRIKVTSIIDCRPASREIIKAMEKALTPEYIYLVQASNNPYGEGNTSELIVAQLEKILSQEEINLKKAFYDIEVKD